MNPAPNRPTAPSVHCSLLAALLIAVYAVSSWTCLRPTSIVNDWMGWRQADTQQMALNGIAPDARFNVPRIDWGGPQPMPVEAEFQAYTQLTGLLLRAFGPQEWPGQCVSLLALSIGAALLFLWLRGRLGDGPALVGLATFLVNRNTLFLGSSVQPDGLALMAFIAGLYAFERWTLGGRPGTWMAWVGFTTLSGLIKPLNLQLGIVQFLVSAATRRDLLRKAPLWSGWAAILVLVGLQLWHGANIHAESGLTFGVISGGDSKSPSLADLGRWQHYRDMFYVSLDWGLQPIGLLAGLFLLLRRRLCAMEWSLGIAYAIAMVYAMRYTSFAPFGSHYHATALVLASLLAAHAMDEIRGLAPPPSLLTGFLCVVLAVQLGWNVRARLHQGRGSIYEEGYVEAAQALQGSIAPGTPILVRSEASQFVGAWRGSVNNYEDPRLFYLLHTAGWALPRDSATVADLESYWRKGARWYLEPVDTQSSPEQLEWLKAQGELVYDQPQARAWRLRAE